MQDIILKDSKRNYFIKENSVLLKIEKFYKNQTVTKFEESTNKKETNLTNINSISSVFMKRMSLPRNICFGYKIEDKNNKNEISNKNKRKVQLPKINITNAKITAKERFNLITNYLKKKDNIKKDTPFQEIRSNKQSYISKSLSSSMIETSQMYNRYLKYKKSDSNKKMTSKY